jgi:hypothetical protein
MTAPTERGPDAAAHLPQPSADPRWRRLDVLASVAFLLALTFPLGLFAAGARPPLIDNRPLLTPPPLSPSVILDPATYTAMDRYLADVMALRGYAVEIRSAIDAGVLGGTVTPEVVRGTGDWLFSRAELDPNCRWSAADIGDQLDRLERDFTAAGQTFRFVAVPDKRVIYPDRLRTDIDLPVACTDARRQPLRSWIAARATVAVDGWAPLLAARASEGAADGLYYTQDSHWTPQGAIVVIRDLVRSLDPAQWDDSQVVEDGVLERRQELARQMGISNTITVPRLRVRPANDLDRSEVDTSATLANAAAIYRYTASGPVPTIPGRTLIVYDSFFGITQGLVAPFFAESVWVHAGDLGRNPQLATELGRFDRVILERVERGLYDTDVEKVLRPMIGAG